MVFHHISVHHGALVPRLRQVSNPESSLVCWPTAEALAAGAEGFGRREFP